VFDLSLTKLLVLAVIAVVIFGPDQLPRVASQAGRALRELRRLADGARNELREGLGPEFSEFDISDLNPRNFVRKHLFEDPDGAQQAGVSPSPAAETATLAPSLQPGEAPPYDSEAT
jgi:sec-independent protein translocase protein TatB